MKDIANCAVFQANIFEGNIREPCGSVGKALSL